MSFLKSELTFILTIIFLSAVFRTHLDPHVSKFKLLSEFGPSGTFFIYIKIWETDLVFSKKKMPLVVCCTTPVRNLFHFLAVKNIAYILV